MGMSAHGDPPTAGGPAAEVAARARLLAAGNPREARDLARSVLAGRPRDPDVVASAHATLGISAIELGEIDTALDHLRRARAALTGAGLPPDPAVEMAYSRALAYAGSFDAALEAAEGVRPTDELGWGRLEAHRALLLQRLGRHHAAIVGYKRAIRSLRAAGDAEGEANALANRGIARAEVGDLDGARADLEAAMAIHAELGLDLFVADDLQNLGFVATRQGDIPGALARFDEAEALQRRHGVFRASVLLDRGEALLAARLCGDAREVAARAESELSRAGLYADLAEARLMSAQALLVGGWPEEAAEEAAKAVAAFADQGRTVWAALAEQVLVSATWRAGGADARLAARAAAAADVLDDAGLSVPAAEARVTGARILLETGDAAGASELLERARSLRTSGPALARVRAWYAEALSRRVRGDRQGAYRALRRGLDILAGSRVLLGATELRVHAAGHGEELVELGLTMAAETGRAPGVLEWAERGRALGLWVRRARPDPDPVMRRLLDQLRVVVGELERAALDGSPDPALLRRAAALEEDIRRRHRRSEEPWTSLNPPTPADIRKELTATPGATPQLVEFAVVDGALLAVVVGPRGSRLVRLGPAGVLERSVRSLRSAQRRLVRPGATRSPGARMAAVAALEAAAGEVEAILGPAVAGDRPLIVVPDGPVRDLPWGLLPGLRDRPVTVVPSAAMWLHLRTMGRLDAQRRQRRGHGRRILAVAGPDLPAAGPEVAALADALDGVEVLAGAAATSRAVLDRLAFCDVLHAAAHGDVRAGNPLFSALRLSDGPLTVLDLASAASLPSTVVLSACDVGRDAVGGAGAVVGMVSVLLASGVRRVVAGTDLAADLGTAPVAVELHRLMAAGRSPAEALALIRAGAGDPAAVAAAAVFTAFGDDRGWPAEAGSSGTAGDGVDHRPVDLRRSGG